MLRYTTLRYAILLATRQKKCAIVFVHDDTGTRIQAPRRRFRAPVFFAWVGGLP
jgi:hypothetical protein